jgi:hypothetical protein
MRFRIGDIVKVERNEVRYPSRGTWPRYRGRIGTVVHSNQQGEIGVAFKATWRGENNELKWQGSDTTWFLPHELIRLDSVLTRAAGLHPDDR